MIFLIFSFLLFFTAIVEKKIIFKISFFIILFFFCMTYGFGYDWINYRYAYYHSLDPGFIPFFAEPGYFYLMKVGLFSGLSFGVFSSIVTLFIYSSIYFFCIKLENRCLALFSLFSFLSIYILNEWIRQGLAVAFVLFSLIQLNKGNKGGFITLVLIAGLFHISALVSLSYYYMHGTSYGKIKNKKGFIFLTIFVFIVLFSLYNPTLVNFIPIIGEKLFAYGSILEGAGVGFWEYVLTSKVVFAYFFMLCFIYLLYRQDKVDGSALLPMYMLFLSRLTQALIRIGYYFVPALVLSMDGRFIKERTGLKTSLNKLVYMTSVLMISCIPAWNDAIWYGSQTHLTIFSNSNEINIEISRKCKVINKYNEHHTIDTCRW